MIMPSKRPSVAERARLFAAGAPVVAAYFLGDVPVFVLGEEALLFVPREGEPERVAVHGGGILAAASDGERILTGGDDGTVVATRADRSHEVVATDAKRRWIDHVAPGPDGIVGWSAGKEAFVTARSGEPRHVEVPSTAGGLAFAPKGVRLAIAHYNGVTLWFPNAQAKPERLEWKGSHIAASFSPDGRFLVTAMQEPMLHGWRLVDGKHMRMSGYTAKVRSMSWSANGKALATSGSRELIAVAVPGQGRADGQRAGDARAAQLPRHHGRLPSPHRHRRGRLRGRHRAPGAHARRRRNPRAPPRRKPGLRARLERRRHAAGVCDGGGRSGGGGVGGVG